MSCPGHDELMLWLDGESGPERAREIAEHVASCTACNAVIEGQKRLERAYRDSYSPPPQEGFDMLERRLRSRIETRRSIPVLIPVAAALLVALAGLRLFGGREVVLLPGLDRHPSPRLELHRDQALLDTTTVTVVAQAPAGGARQTSAEEASGTGSDFAAGSGEGLQAFGAVSTEGSTGSLTLDEPGGTGGLGGTGGGGGGPYGGYGLLSPQTLEQQEAGDATTAWSAPPCENLQQLDDEFRAEEAELELDLCRSLTSSSVTAGAECACLSADTDAGILILFDSLGEPSSPDSAFLDESLPGWKDSLRGMLLDSAASFPPGGLAEIMGDTGD